MRNLVVLGLLACASLIEPAAAHEASPAPPSASQPSFYGTKIEVGNFVANVRFYTEFLGMTKMPNPSPGPETSAMLRFENGSPRGLTEGPILVFYTAKSAPQLGTAYNALVFIVSDVDATVARMQTAGVKVLQAPQHTEEAVIAYVADPDGRRVQLIQAPRP